MFAYCNNNPICLIDSIGQIPWVIAGLIGAGAAFVFGLIHKKSPKKIVIDIVKGGVFGVLSTLSATARGFIAGYEVLSKFVECLSEGYSCEETIAAVSLTAVEQIAFPSTNNQLTDDLVECTFGFVKDLESEVGIELIDRNAGSSSGKTQVTCVTFSTTSTGAVNSGLFRTVQWNFLEGKSLCLRH